jgi:hypothetical protein
MRLLEFLRERLPIGHLSLRRGSVDEAGERAQFRRVKTQKYKESDGSPLPRGSTAGLFRKHGRVKLQNDRRTTETFLLYY